MRIPLMCLLVLLPGAVHGQAPAPAPQAGAPQSLPILPASELRFAEVGTLAHPYPVLAEIGRIQGKVRVRILLDAEGRVEAVKAMDGPGLLKGAAERAVKACRFTPARVDGKPVRAASEFVLPFALKASEIEDSAFAATGYILKQDATGQDALGRESAAFLDRNLRAWLEGYGLKPADPAKADPLRTLELRVGLEGNGLDQRLSVRVSLLADRRLDENLPGKGLRLWAFRSHLAARNGAEMQDCLQATLEGIQEALMPGEGKAPTPVLASGRLAVLYRPPLPPYPSEAVRDMIEGRVAVEVQLDAQGAPRWARAVDGPGVLQRNASVNCLGWQFQVPGAQGISGTPRIRVSVPFTLR